MTEKSSFQWVEQVAPIVIDSICMISSTLSPHLSSSNSTYREGLVSVDVEERFSFFPILISNIFSGERLGSGSSYWLDISVSAAFFDSSNWVRLKTKAVRR